MSMFQFDNTFARELEGLYVACNPEQFANPKLVLLNRELAEELGLNPTELEPVAGALFSGNRLPAGASPLAQAYAGHQFGRFVPQLGDGRAHLLGELVDRSGQRRDLQLKGSGRTPFSRRGDGRATLGPVLREYLVSEAMHRLGVPTTRALAAVTTGEIVQRDGSQPGAVITRIAASHLRVGTFEYVAARGEINKLQQLTTYALARHVPDHGARKQDLAIELLRRVAVAQAELIATWMRLGFIHGVMNTDNTTISGETIDYGPCAFMDVYDPATVFSSIDHHGRYAYGNQPSIGAWNLSRLAAALSPVMPGDEASNTEQIKNAISLFVDTYQTRWLAGMRAKIGLELEHDGDVELIESLLQVMKSQQLDFTSIFRVLATILQQGPNAIDEPAASSPPFQSWTKQWMHRLTKEPRDLADIAFGMNRVNPVYIPRNHLVETALEAAVSGDLSPFLELHTVLSNPYQEQPNMHRYARPAPANFGPYRTFCGT